MSRLDRRRQGADVRAIVVGVGIGLTLALAAGGAWIASDSSTAIAGVGLMLLACVVGFATTALDAWFTR